MSNYDIPESVEELFAAGEATYRISDPEKPGDNIFGLNLFLECLEIPNEMIEEWEGTRLVIFDGEARLQIDSGGFGDFHLHQFDVSLLEF